jgi:hypothetical protein
MTVENDHAEMREVLAGAFTSPNFQHLRGNPNLCKGNHNSTKIAFVIARKSRRFPNCPLNCSDYDRIRAAKRDGKADRFFIVLAKFNKGIFTYLDHIDLEKADEWLRNRPPTRGPYGSFWPLPLSFATTGFADDDADFDEADEEF